MRFAFSAAGRYAWRKYGTPCLHANYFPTWLIPEEAPTLPQPAAGIDRLRETRDFCSGPVFRALV